MRLRRYVTAAVTGQLLLAAVGHAQTRTAVVCSTAPAQVLNPLVSPDAAAADLRLVLFTPLVLYNDQGGFRPYLARTWSWSNDNKKLVFQIRDDVKWHDGKTVMAEDVAWTILRAANREFALRNGQEFANVTSARAVGSTTVEVEFKQPFAAQLEPFTLLPIMPKQLLENYSAADFAKAPYHRDPIGSGPYKFVTRNADRSLVFERATTFPTALGRPQLDRIIMRAIPEPAAMLTELQTGNVDVCITGSAIMERAQKIRTLRVLGIPPTVTYAVPLNARRAPFNDARVRRAFSAALNRADLAFILSPVAIPARTMLPMTSSYIAKEFAQPDKNLRLAAALLDSAGWRTNSSGLRSNAEGQPLKITIAGPQSHTPVLTALQAQLKQVGFTVELRLLEGATYVALLQNPDQRPEAMSLGYVPDRTLFPDYYDQFHSKSARNLAAYNNPAVDSIVEAMRVTISPEKRKKLYRDLQRFIGTDIPTVYTAYSPRLTVVGPRLKGLKIGLNGPFSSLLDWSVAR